MKWLILIGVRNYMYLKVDNEQIISIVFEQIIITNSKRTNLIPNIAYYQDVCDLYMNYIQYTFWIEIYNEIQ